MRFRYFAIACAAPLCGGTFDNHAHAGKWRGRHRAACAQAAPGYYRPAPIANPYYAPPAPAPAAPQPATTTGGDAAGFVAWLNQTRAAYGLPPVGYSAEAEASCRQNNLIQAARGMGHHFMGCHRRQNAAMGLSFPGVESAWMNSPGHRSALLDPTITAVGIAWYGAYATFGAY